MSRPNTPEEQAALIRVIIEEVKIRGRLMDIVGRMPA